MSKFPATGISLHNFLRLLCKTYSENIAAEIGCFRGFIEKVKFS